MKTTPNPDEYYYDLYVRTTYYQRRLGQVSQIYLMVDFSYLVDHLDMGLKLNLISGKPNIWTIEYNLDREFPLFIYVTITKPVGLIQRLVERIVLQGVVPLAGLTLPEVDGKPVGCATVDF